MNRSETSQSIVSNMLWFLASLGVALVVWLVATLQANPIDQQRFQRIQVNILTDDNVIVTNNPTQMAVVFVRAQTSVLNLLDQEDIVVTADLRGRAPGETYTVPLEVAIARPAAGDTQPSQITVAIEQVVAQQKPVEIVVMPPSASSFVYDNLQTDVLQAEVRGAATAVEAVQRVIGELDLRDVRSPVERSVSLLAVDEDGSRVSAVTVTPRTANVQVDVEQRADVRDLLVNPDIQYETLGEEFEIRDVLYEPSRVTVQGATPEDVADLGNIIRTEPITLAGRTNTFTITVPLVLPGEDVFLVSEPAAVTVQVFIDEDTMSRTFEEIPVTILGELGDAQVVTNPQVVSMLVNAPVSTIRQIAPEDIQVIVDIAGLPDGVTELAPQVTFRQGQIAIPSRNITLLPPRIEVSVVRPTPAVTPTTPPAITEVVTEEAVPTQSP